MTELVLGPRARSPLTPTAVLFAVAAVAAAAWVVLAQRMAGMDSGPGGDPGPLGWFAATWAMMTAAMMLPASALAVLRVVRASRLRGPGAALGFLSGYGTVWMLAGLAGYSLIEAVRDVHPGALGWSAAGRYVAGAALVAAALYQLTRAKRRWLARCTEGEVHLRRDGRVGALLAGIEHGCCCVACCWTLMAALYALGMMSIAWMVGITLLIASERLLPNRARAAPAIAAVLFALGLGLAVAPADVPALTIPPKPDPAMMGMHGPTGRAR